MHGQPLILFTPSKDYLVLRGAWIAGLQREKREECFETQVGWSKVNRAGRAGRSPATLELVEG